MPAELGFEDCSAELRSIPDHPASVDTFFLGQHEQVGPKQWQFYAFNVTQEDYQVVVNMAGEVTAECELLSCCPAPAAPCSLLMCYLAALQALSTA